MQQFSKYKPAAHILRSSVSDLMQDFCYTQVCDGPCAPIQRNWGSLVLPQHSSEHSFITAVLKHNNIEGYGELSPLRFHLNPKHDNPD
jgi:hypothetical protein